MVELALTAHAGDATADPAQAADRYWTSPRQLAAALRRRWRLIGLCGLVGAAATFSVARQLPPVYVASATVTMVPGEAADLQSDARVQRVLESLHLARGAAITPTLLQQAASWLARQLGQPAPRPSDAPSGSMERLRVVADALGASAMVQFSDPDPQVAAAFVNALVRDYVADRVQARDAVRQQASEALERQMAQMRPALAALEQRIAETRARYAQSGGGSVGQQQIDDLNTEVARAGADRAQAESDYARAADIAAGGDASTDGAPITGAGTLNTLRAREADAEQRVALLSTTLGSANPRLRAAEAELSSTRTALAAASRRMVASLGARRDAARAREADLQRQLAAAQSSLTAGAGAQADLRQLQQQSDSRRAALQALQQTAARAPTEDAPDGGVPRLIRAAVPPTVASGPPMATAALLGLLGGCGFGGLVALGRGGRQTGFARAEEISAVTGLAALATVPGLAGRDASLAAAVVAEPTGPAAEAMRALRMRLRFAGRQAAPHSVLFVSSVAGEGASSVAAAFARVAALDGMRVLLVEGDVRSPALSRLLGVAPSDGLIQALGRPSVGRGEGDERDWHGPGDWRDQVVRDPHTKLQLLLAGDGSASSVPALEPVRLQNLLTDAREDYTLVVMDAQPVTLATHAMMLGPLADAVVLVVQALTTPRAAVRIAAATMGAASRRAPVALLNQA